MRIFFKREKSKPDEWLEDPEQIINQRKTAVDGGSYEI